MKKQLPYLKIICSMLAFSFIGIVRRNIPLPSATLSMTRGYIGALFLLLCVLATKKKVFTPQLIKKLPVLILSGAGIGLNWMLLFEAYNYTTVAKATLCYYMAPIFVIAFTLKGAKGKKLLRSILCIVAACAGAVLISGVIGDALPSAAEAKGLLLGLAAAVLYAVVILVNKQIESVDDTGRTLIQLLSAAVAITPYALLGESTHLTLLTTGPVLLILEAGILQTGFAYYLYFSALPHIPAQRVAVLSYIDPVGAIVLSTLLLGEPFSLLTIPGAALILGAAALSE